MFELLQLVVALLLGWYAGRGSMKTVQLQLHHAREKEDRDRLYDRLEELHAFAGEMRDTILNFHVSFLGFCAIETIEAPPTFPVTAADRMVALVQIHAPSLGPQLVEFHDAVVQYTGAITPIMINDPDERKKEQVPIEARARFDEVIKPLRDLQMAIPKLIKKHRAAFLEEPEPMTLKSQLMSARDRLWRYLSFK